jgi:hypothetical protein
MALNKVDLPTFGSPTIPQDNILGSTPLHEIMDAMHPNIINQYAPKFLVGGLHPDIHPEHRSNEGKGLHKKWRFYAYTGFAPIPRPCGRRNRFVDTACFAQVACAALCIRPIPTIERTKTARYGANFRTKKKPSGTVRRVFRRIALATDG